MALSRSRDDTTKISPRSAQHDRSVGQAAPEHFEDKTVRPGNRASQDAPDCAFVNSHLVSESLRFPPYDGISSECPHPAS